MNKTQKGLTIFTLVFFFVCFTAVTTAAEESVEYNPGSFPVADVTVGPHGITFQPKVGYGSLVLTVSKPNGEVISKSFASGTTPYLELSGDFIDGSYTYELKVMPVSVKRDRLSTVESKGTITREVETQTGYFFVKGGRIVTSPGEKEIGIAKPLDQLILDDLIVDGSACIGFDCVNGENFGFDTLRLKENNLRIRFQDTSTSASFPSNDWQITANDSENGGANKFSIDDIDSGKTPFTIEAGTRANALYVDDSGRVGLGTSTPAEDLHIWYGDTPTIRLHQSGSGWAPQTWDIAGNEANFFIRDVTNGSELPFRIKPGADTNSLFIAGDGDIGLGTDSPGFPLHLEDANGATAVFEDTTNGTQAQISAGNQYVFIGSKTNNEFRLTVNDSPSIVMETDGDVGIGEIDPAHPLVVGTANGAYLNTSGNWVNPSRRELKENIADLSSQDALETLSGLNPVRFNYKVDKEKERVGFIAEDVPELVATKDRDGMVPMDVVAVLTKVVKEQQKTIAELKKEIAELKKR